MLSLTDHQYSVPPIKAKYSAVVGNGLESASIFDFQIAGIFGLKGYKSNNCFYFKATVSYTKVNRQYYHQLLGHRCGLYRRNADTHYTFCGIYP